MKKLVVFVVLLSGCGSATAVPRAATTTTTPEQAVVAAGRAYASAFLSDQPAVVYATWTARCKATQTEKEVADTINSYVAQYSSARLLDATATVSGNSAKYTAHYDIPALDKTNQQWTFEAGQWKWDGC